MTISISVGGAAWGTKPPPPPVASSVAPLHPVGMMDPPTFRALVKPGSRPSAATRASRALSSSVDSVSLVDVPWSMTYSNTQSPCAIAADIARRVDETICPRYCHDGVAWTLCRATPLLGYSSLPSALTGRTQTLYSSTSDPYLLRGCFADSDVANLGDGGLVLHELSLAPVAHKPEHVVLESFCPTSVSCTEFGTPVLVGADNVISFGANGARAQCVSFLAPIEFKLAEVGFRVAATSFNNMPRSPPSAAPGGDGFSEHSGDGDTWVDYVLGTYLAAAISVIAAVGFLMLLGCVIVIQYVNPQCARRILDVLSVITNTLNSAPPPTMMDVAGAPPAEDQKPAEVSTVRDSVQALASAMPTQNMWHGDSNSARERTIVAGQPIKVKRSSEVRRPPAPVSYGHAIGSQAAHLVD
jgi:hypothetical protein